MKLKICGMGANVLEVAELHPDYLGFIFWEPSLRYYDKSIPEIPKGISKIGVFVDESIPNILLKIKVYDLNLIQLHGKESPAFFKELRKELSLNKLQPKLIKVFSVNDSFNFETVFPFEEVCDFFLFDTKGKLPGGNGFHFDWSMLQNYPSKKPFFLSGGIGPDDIYKIFEFLNSPWRPIAMP